MSVRRYRIVSLLMMIGSRRFMLKSGKNVEIREKAQYDGKEPDRQKFEEDEQKRKHRIAVSHRTQ